jgi:hypothetical protein
MNDRTHRIVAIAAVAMEKLELPFIIKESYEDNSFESRQHWQCIQKLPSPNVQTAEFDNAVQENMLYAQTAEFDKEHDVSFMELERKEMNKNLNQQSTTLDV